MTARELLWCGAVMAIVAGSLGCVSDTAGKPDASAIRRTDVHPSGLVLVVPNSFLDTDSDRLLDSATIVLYVMGPAGPRGELLPIESPGQVNLWLADRDGRTIAEWRFDTDMVKARWATLGPGPAIVFKLTLPKPVQARQRRSGDISCTFHHPDGGLLRSSRPEPIVYGPAD